MGNNRVQKVTKRKIRLLKTTAITAATTNKPQ